jgi:hypothetical protein
MYWQAVLLKRAAWWGSLANGSRGARILLDNFTEMAPIVYTPTVGWACLNYHLLFRRPRGMYFSANDKGEMVRRAACSG